MAFRSDRRRQRVVVVFPRSVGVVSCLRVAARREICIPSWPAEPVGPEGFVHCDLFHQLEFAGQNQFKGEGRTAQDQEAGRQF